MKTERKTDRMAERQRLDKKTQRQKDLQIETLKGEITERRKDRDRKSERQMMYDRN